MSDKVACNSAFAVLTAVTGLFVDPSTVTCNAEKVAPGAKDIFSLKVRINLLPSLEISEEVNVGSPLEVGAAVVKLRVVLSTVFNLEIFPPDIYFLERLPSELSISSISIIFILSLAVSAVASYLPAMNITKMKTFRALKYE